MKNLLSTMYFFLKNYSPEEVAYLLIRCNKTKFFLRNTNNTDRNDLNKQNTQTHTHQTSKEIWHWKGGEGVPTISLTASKFLLFFDSAKKKQAMTSPLFWTWDLSVHRNQLFLKKILHVKVKTVSLKVPDFL